MAVMARNALRGNDVGQALFRVIAAFGASGYETAVLLVKYRFDITRAALHLGLARGCRRCETETKSDPLRGCETCVASLRMRVHRVQDRVQGILGDATPTSRGRRPKVVFNADRSEDDGGSEDSSGGRPRSWYRMAAAPEGPGAEEL